MPEFGRSFPEFVDKFSWKFSWKFSGNVVGNFFSSIAVKIGQDQVLYLARFGLVFGKVHVFISCLLSKLLFRAIIGKMCNKSREQFVILR